MRPYHLSAFGVWAVKVYYVEVEESAFEPHPAAALVASGAFYGCHLTVRTSSDTLNKDGERDSHLIYS